MEIGNGGGTGGAPLVRGAEEPSDVYESGSIASSRVIMENGDGLVCTYFGDFNSSFKLAKKPPSTITPVPYDKEQFNGLVKDTKYAYCDKTTEMRIDEKSVMLLKFC
ncbi:hypothetical protein APICC_02469 [Apis cerana cerana]|uniref:Uncharacterized protein n=1 Tax=Apis cerana cerana TaxID=94128 RepID=A0A2A3EJ79_APICC|nr:hypothetical protein APICC_02469 [Apis cerana cerana]